MAGDATNKQAAARLFVSPCTVDHYLRNVFAKLGIASRSLLTCLQVDELPGASGEETRCYVHRRR